MGRGARVRHPAGRRAGGRPPHSPRPDGAVRRHAGLGRSAPGRLACDGRRRAAVHPPGRHGGGGAGGRRDGGHGHRERQVAGVQPAGAERDRAGRRNPRHVPVPDQGPRPGSGAFALRALPAQPAAGDLRRRHAAGGAPPGAGLGEPALDQPGHAAHRDPAGARHLGRVSAPPALRGARRGPRLPWRVRVARRERARPAAADLRALRFTAGVHPGVGDDRQPRPGRLDAGRAAGRGDRGRRGACRGARGRGLEPASARSRVRHPGEHAGRSGDAARRTGRPRSADDRLRPLAQGLRAGLPVRPRGADPERARPPRPRRPLPRRLHARATSHDRTRTGGRHPARRGRHERARARHRHRHARLLDLRRLPGRHVVAAPAVGPRGPPGHGAGAAGRRRGSARPVPGAPSAGAARPAGRGRGLESGEPGGARRSPAVRRRGAAADAGRRRATSATPASSWRGRCRTSRPALPAWSTAAPIIPRRVSRCARPRRTPSP